MYKILLIILVIQSIHGDDDESNEKYIDLLPEEEKQEFLNRIASRILEGVNSPDIPNESHAEVNEEQLDAQNAYVNQIIKEESKNLQNKRRNEHLSNEDKSSNKGDKKGDNERHIDLTLRAGTQEEKNDSQINEHLETRELKVLPVKKIEENDNLHDKSSESNVDTKVIPDVEYTTKLGIGVENDLITTNDSQSTENINSIRKSFDDKLLFRTTISNYDPSSEENTSVTEDETIVTDPTVKPDDNENSNTTESHDEIIWISTKKIFDSENESNENINFESAEKVSSSVFTTLPDEEITTFSVTNLTSESDAKEPKITTVKTPATSVDFNQLSNKTLLNKNLFVRSEASDLKKVVNVTQLTHNSLINLKRNETAKNISNTVSDTNIINSNDSKSNVSGLRSRYLDNNDKESVTVKESEIEMSLNKIDLKPDAKEYEVFELVEDRPPFVTRSKLEIKDTPYYVPVYNYAPDYAYFRPRSRFEPEIRNILEHEKTNYETYGNNDEKDNQQLQLESPSSRSIFSGYNKRETALYRNKPDRYILQNQYKNIFDLTKPLKKNNIQNIYYNTNDYLDMDYYYGRSNIHQLRSSNNEIADTKKEFPDSNEEDHPYHSIHKSDSVKDHIRAVRKLLYLKQIFEHIPNLNKKELRKFYDKRIQKPNFDIKYNRRDELVKQNVDNIAIDYYFGLTPNNDAFRAVRLNKSNNKQLRNPEKSKSINAREDYKLNEIKSNTNIINNKLGNKLDKMIGPVLLVLRDFIRFDNEALSRYNWLETAVDIMSAIKKLLDLTKKLQFGEHLHPKDIELLKYTLYLYKSTVNKFNKEIPDVNVDIIKKLNVKKGSIKRKKGLLPKNKWNNRIRKPLKLWQDVANFIRNRDEKQERIKLLYDFEDFLQSVLFFLHDFHDAIKHIAIITKYKNQKWYEDLKNIYLDSASDEKLLKLLLHVSVTKLLNYLENSATDGAEDNFKDYLINNKQYVERSKEEFLFVLNILHELRKLSNNKLY